MVLLVSEAHVVEGLPAKEVKESTSKLDKLKEEPQLKEEAAPAEKAAEQGEGGEPSSAGEDEKKGGEETSNLKSGGDVDGGSADTNGGDDGGSAETHGGDDGHGETELENMENPVTTNGEAKNGSNTNGEDAPLNVTLDQSKTTTNSSSTHLTNSPEPGSDGNENDKSTDTHDTKTSTGSDTMATDSSSVGNPNL